MGVFLFFLSNCKESLAIGEELNAGQELNRQIKAIENFKIKKEIEKGSQIQKKEEKEEISEKEKYPEIEFILKKVEHNDSKILTKLELKSIIKDYENKKVNLNEMFELVEKINKLYEKKGYVVCKAIIPPQIIENGVFKIILIEGETDKIEIKNNKSTKDSYILKRMDSLKKGDISNFNELNKNLVWFNSVEDISIEIQMKAGEKFGTTDYILNVKEPKKTDLIVYANNTGSESTGEYKGGFAYANHSVFGYRDSLNLVGAATEGSMTGVVSYSIPISRKGTRLEPQYSANEMSLKNGDYAELDTKGSSKNYQMTISQPLFIRRNLKINSGLTWGNQKSSTTILDNKWIDDTTEKVSGYMSILKYFNRSVFYMKNTYSYLDYEDIKLNKKYFTKYEVNMLFQRLLENNAIVYLKINGQGTADEYLPSSEQFFIGGSYMGRGYPESFMGADKGIACSLEYEVPIVNKMKAFMFFDGGMLYGETSYEDKEIYSAGYGVRGSFYKNLDLSLTMGIPMETDYNGEKIDSFRLHFVFSYKL